MKLAKLKQGEKCIVKKIDLGSEKRLQLNEAGITLNTQMRFIMQAPFSGPKMYLVRGIRIAIREADADRIEVEKITGGNI